MGRCWKLFLVVALAGMGATADAQFRGRYRSNGGGGDPAERLARQMQRAERLIQSFDPNGDGVIEPNEVRGQLRLVYERMAKEAGLNPTQSISVRELRAAVARRFKKLEEGNSKSSTSKTPASGDKSKRESSKQGKPTSQEKSAPEVAGFGVQGEGPKVAGFGQPASGGSSPARSTPSHHHGSRGESPPSGSSSSNPPKKKELDSRIRRYAESLLRRYDANKNGVLEKGEWSKMRNSPEKYDRNRDGVVTVEELSVRLAGFGQGSPPGSRSPPSPTDPGRRHSHSPRPSRSSNSEERKSYRFLTPTERLPRGLPDWFARKDANGDGQVSMAEYHAGDWDEAKAEEFGGYDLNNDGMITPAECLQAEEEK